MLAFFIDADNLCMPGWVEEAFGELETLGASIAVRRAYGSAEKLKGLAGVLQTRHIRLFVNAAVSKNTTDVALAVDAMELSYQKPQPETIVIGSGDADFVPLVLRLRERGFRMVCVSERGKMAPEAVYAYDRVILVGQASPASPPLVPPTIQPAPAKKVAAQKAAAKKPSAKKEPAKKVAAKKAKPAAPQTADIGKVTVEKILNAATALRSGEPQPLNDIARLLHDAKLLGKNASSPKLFKKFPHHFELMPPKQPNRVRYIPAL